MLSTSVLVPSFGRPSSLQACLGALGRQTVPPGEVIVVWQGDDTPTRDAALGAAGGLSFPVRVLHLADPGIVPAENLALENTSGELILMTDDDAVVPPDWVERLAAHYDDPTIGAVGGLTVNHENGKPHPVNTRTPVGRISWYGRVYGNFHNRPPDDTGHPPREVDHLIGCNMSLRRSAFDRFESRLRRYWQQFEVEVCLQVKSRGYRVLLDPGIVIDHYLTPRVSVYASGREGDLEQKVGNAAYNMAFVLSKHTRAPDRWARWAYAMALGTTEVPGPLLLPVSVRKFGRPLRELAVASLALRRRLAGWGDGRRASGDAAAGGR
jgi:GT2 family glycosyltransferase